MEKTIKRKDRKKTKVGGKASAVPGKKRKQTNVSYPKRRVRRKERKRWWTAPWTAAMACVIVALSVYIIGGLAGYAQFTRMRAAVDRDTFYPGITVDGEDMSGYTYDQALAAWGEKARSYRQAHNISLTIEGETWDISDEEMGFYTDYRDVLESAWSVGRYGTLEQRYATIRGLDGVWARAYSSNTAVDEGALESKLNAIAASASESGVEATITGFDAANKDFAFEEGKDGYVVDVLALKSAVKEKIEAGGGALTVERQLVTHDSSVEALRKRFGMMSSALTEARTSSDNRLTNLRVACKAINGLCIQPGEVFSMNGALGKRTKKKGYKAAGALENGVHTTQVGGGICQVTTTLFNAVGRADMDIVEREPHSIPSDYVALGRDATVNWPNQDFKWRNNTDYPVYIVAGLNGKRQVIVQLYGKLREDGVTVKLVGVKNETYRPLDPIYVYTNSLPTGERKVVEEKRKGYLATTYRVYYKDGKEIDKQFLFKSYYAPAGARIQVGK